MQIKKTQKNFFTSIRQNNPKVYVLLSYSTLLCFRFNWAISLQDPYISISLAISISKSKEFLYSFWSAISSSYSLINKLKFFYLFSLCICVKIMCLTFLKLWHWTSIKIIELVCVYNIFVLQDCIITFKWIKNMLWSILKTQGNKVLLPLNDVPIYNAPKEITLTSFFTVNLHGITHITFWYWAFYWKENRLST